LLYEPKTHKLHFILYKKKANILGPLFSNSI